MEIVGESSSLTVSWVRHKRTSSGVQSKSTSDGHSTATTESGWDRISSASPRGARNGAECAGLAAAHT